MAKTKLEEARERLGRLMTKAHVAGGHPADDEDQSNDAHLGREFIRSRADLRLILAELDRRSPPTREALKCEAMRAALERIANTGQSIEPDHWKFRCMARELADAALAAAPPPPDVSRGLDREEVARIIEGAIADSMCGDWGVAVDDAADAIIALSAPAGGGEVEPQPESAAGAWRPIESAPRDGTWFLGHGRTRVWDNCTFACRFAEDIGGYTGWQEATGGKPVHPTHWMPTPAWPRAEGLAVDPKAGSVAAPLPASPAETRPEPDAIGRALQRFNDLPAEAIVRIPVAEVLFGCSEKTLRRRVAAGTFPALVSVGLRLKGWRAGDLRAALAAAASRP